jgi:CRP/FNR family transcriptional regulator
MFSDEGIKQLLNELNERNKELNCLYKIEEILRDFNSDLNSTIYKLVDILPLGWQFSDICKVKIIINSDEFTSQGFKRTELKLSTPIISDSKQIGEIQIYYIKPVKLERKRIFLPEEYKLLTTIADKLGNYILYRKLLDNIAFSNINNSTKKQESSIQLNDIESWLASCFINSENIEKICSNQIHFRKGETILKQGAFSTYIFLLKEGYTKSYIEGIQDSNYIFSINKAFQFIGLSSIYGNNHYHFSVNAITQCDAYIIDNELIKRMAIESPQFNSFLMKWYCNTFERLYKRMDCLANKQSVGRIADVLIYLQEKIFENKFLKGIITRKEIAEMAGMSTEGAVRILSELKNDSIINIQKEGIEILRHDLLKTISLA